MKTQFRKNGIEFMTPRAGRFKRETVGTAAIEFALLAPVLLLLLVGMFQFGITINNYIQLTEAVRVGDRTLAISRGSSTPIATTRSAIFNSAPSLTQGSVGITLTVNGNSCNIAGSTPTTTEESSCAGYLTSGQGQQATVTATYSCSLVVMGRNYSPSCQLSSTTSGRIE